MLQVVDIAVTKGRAHVRERAEKAQGYLNHDCAVTAGGRRLWWSSPDLPEHFIPIRM